MNLFKELLEDERQTKFLSPVSFKRGIDYNDNNKMSQRDATSLIQQAENDVEEVDTVAYGLELNDGEIVKVYVNVDHADQFEKAMADMLGKEDDVEQAINELSSQIDIVSVEWPEQRQDQTNAQGQPEEKPEEISSEDGSQAKETKIKLGFPLVKKDEGEEDKKEGDKEGEEKPEGEEDKPEEDIGFEGDEEEKDLESGEEKPEGEEDLESDEETSDEEESDEEDSDEEGADKKGKKKKKAKKEENQLSFEHVFSSKLTKSILIEKPESKEMKLEDIFKTSMQRKIVRLIFLLNFPVDRLLSQKAGFRKSVREASLKFAKDGRARFILNKLINELESISDVNVHQAKEKEFAKQHDEEDLKEDTKAREINAVIDFVIDLFLELGVPHNAVKSKASMLRQHVRQTAKLILQHTKVRNYVHQLHRHLVKHKKEEDINEEVSLGSDVYLRLISKVLSSLGVPDDNLEYKKFNLIKSLREKGQAINLAQVKARLTGLAKLLGQTDAALTQEELTIVEDDLRRRERASNLGEWNVSRTGDKCQLSVEHVKISLDEKNTKELVRALDNGFEVIVKAGSKHFDFQPINHGVEYTVVETDNMSESVQFGILLPKKSVETILETFNDI